VQFAPSFLCRAWIFKTQISQYNLSIKLGNKYGLEPSIKKNIFILGMKKHLTKKSDLKSSLKQKSGTIPIRKKII
jgi:hypothetical protein